VTTCFCGTISQKACDQLEAAEAEFGAGRDESLGHGVRTAGNRHFLQPAFGVVLLPGQYPAS
jgi:hypothetical protein